MVGMLQILTWMLALYLAMKGVEIMQIGLASSRPERETVLALIGIFSIVICLGGAVALVAMQDQQAASISNAMPRVP